MKKIFGIGVALAIVALSNVAAFAQGRLGGGPGPIPNAWSVNGPTISYSQGGVIVGPTSITGGSEGVGTINVSVGYFVNGVNISSLPCTLCALTTNPLSQFAATTSAQLRGVLSDETGTGFAVFNSAPTIISPVVTTSFTATGLVTNADLVSPSTTVNGVVCTLGSTCTISASAGTITYGSTTVAGGTGVPYNTTSGGLMTAAALANNSVFVTNGSAVPSFSTTLPSAVQANITGTGALTSGSTGVGFTVAFGSSTITGVLGSANGGTGSNNSPFTITLGGSITTAAALTHAGAFATTITVSAVTNSTLPAGTHTLGGLDVVQTWTATQTFVGPVLGAASGTSLALGGATLGGNALAVSGTTTLTSASASALAVGLNGATNPAFAVNASASSQVSGLLVTGSVTAGTVTIGVTDSGSNTNLAINAKGAGATSIGNSSTGPVVIGGGGGGVTISSALTYGGVTLSNSVTGTGSMVLGTSPSISSLTVTTAFTATGLVTFADMATASIATQANYFAGASNVIVPASQIYQAEITVTFGTTTTFDFSTFNNAVETLTGNVTTQTLANVAAGKAGHIRLIQDGTGSRTTVWNSIFKFAGGATPVLSTAAGAIDLLFYDCASSTLCYASLVQNMK